MPDDPLLVAISKGGGLGHLLGDGSGGTRSRRTAGAWRATVHRDLRVNIEDCLVCLLRVHLPVHVGRLLCHM